MNKNEKDSENDTRFSFAGEKSYIGNTLGLTVRQSYETSDPFNMLYVCVMWILPMFRKKRHYVAFFFLNFSKNIACSHAHHQMVMTTLILKIILCTSSR